MGISQYVWLSISCHIRSECPLVSTPYPIIYVRGYAMSAKAVEETFNLPYYGFNLGATQYRQGVEHEPEMHIFESPVIRLMKDHGYVDAYGRFATTQGEPVSGTVPASIDWQKTLWIFRYYDPESRMFDEQRPPFPHYAVRLLVFLNQVRLACGDPDGFQVILVAHSMGGLIARTYLQSPRFFQDYCQPSQNPDTEPELLEPVPVHKLFTFGTPHRGIRFRNALAPLNWLREATGGWREDQFTPAYMRDYLGLSADDPPHVYHPQSHAPDLEYTFSLVGTNAADYVVGGAVGTVGAKSDGLVLTENAYIRGGPRAFIHRAHSGPHGIVNSEEGYQNLRRFLFGNMRFQLRLRFGRIMGRLPRTDRRDVLEHLALETAIAIRGLAGYLDTRSERDLTAEKLELQDVGQGEYRPLGEQDPVLFTGYLFAMKEHRSAFREASGDTYSRWVLDLKIKPHYRRDRWLRNSRFEGDHFLDDRLEAGLGDESATKQLVYRWQSRGPTQHEPVEETPPAGVRARFVIPLPDPAPRYLQDVELVLDISDWH